MTELHLESFGEGEPAVFVHGSFGWGVDTFREQRQLADGHRVVLVDRRGFGRSRGGEALGWPLDREDLAELLDELGPAHLVGHSYGGVVSLLAAGLRPERVRSLVAVEPPAVEAAAGNPAADAATAALKPVYERAHGLTAGEFVRAWSAAGGRTAEDTEGWIERFTAEDWAAAEASRRERWPGDAPIDFEALEAARFPKVFVRGARRPELVPGLRAVCETIANRIDGRVVVFEDSGHNPQLQEPELFNALLRAVWSEAD